MSIINKGTTFSNGEQLTAESLNDMLDLATFNQSATDGTSTSVNSGGQIVVVDAGITSQKLAINSVTTSSIVNNNVTFEKLTDVIDDDTMATATSTNLATSESIRAYVNDSISRARGELQGSTATGTITTTSANTFQDFDLSAVVGSNKAMVIMEVFDGNQNGRTIFFRTKGSSVSPYGASNQAGSNTALLGTNNSGNTVIVTTDSLGFLEVLTGGISVSNINYVVQAFQVIS